MNSNPGGRIAALGTGIALVGLLAACGGPLEAGIGASRGFGVSVANVEQRGINPAAQAMTLRTPVPEAPVVESQVPGDTQIEVQMNQALDGDKDLAFMKIDVHSEDGTVTLRGRAPDPDARERASAIVRTLRSVKAVDNLLTLG